MTTYLSNSEFRGLKSRLTRAQNSGDPNKVLAATAHAFERFEAASYPDAWHTWKIAEYDAIVALQKVAEYDAIVALQKVAEYDAIVALQDSITELFHMNAIR